MSSNSTPRIFSFKAGGAIALGAAVKMGANRETVVSCTANTDPAIGIAQGSISADDATAGVRIEVALQGGGAKAKADANVAAGKFLVSSTDGQLEQTNAAGDRIVAVAMESAVAGDLFAVEVVLGIATGADQ